MIARTMPGKPAPLPRSTIVRASSGTRGASWAESRMCRCHTCGKVDSATRFSCWFLSHSKSTNVDKRLTVSRATPRSLDKSREV
jgi:hypothetical protein